MTFKTEEEVLLHFMGEGCMLDTETGVVYVSDVNDAGEFFGIFESKPVPERARNDLDHAIDWAYCWPMNEYAAPGWWFGELAKEVIAHPERFLA